MFISKKKFEALVQIEADKRMKDFWRDREMDDRFRYVRDDIQDIYKRLDAIEKELHPEKFKHNLEEVVNAKAPY